MSTPTRQNILDQIVALIEGALTNRAGVKVYPRIRYPQDYRDDQYAALVTDDSGSVNVWMVEASGFSSPELTETGGFVAQSYGFRVLYHRSVVDDSEDDTQASRYLFDADMEAVTSALITETAATGRVDLGLGSEVTVTGWQGQATEALLGSILCHILDASLTVRVTPC